MLEETSSDASLLTTDTWLARRTGIPGSTWRRWRAEGQGPPYIQVTATSVRYRIADVDAWLESRTVRPGGPR